MPPSPDAGVITIEGPSCTGKSAVAIGLARQLRWHVLDCDALWRGAGLRGCRNFREMHHLDEPENGTMIGHVACDLNVVYRNQELLVDGQDRAALLKEPYADEAAAKIRTLSFPRHVMSMMQQEFRQPPGLVAEGVDVGADTFPDPSLRILLWANRQTRARRLMLRPRDAETSLTETIAILRDRDAALGMRDDEPDPNGRVVIHTDGENIRDLIDKVIGLALEAGCRPALSEIELPKWAVDRY